MCCSVLQCGAACCSSEDKPIGCPILQVSFCNITTNCMVHLRKENCKGKKHPRHLLPRCSFHLFLSACLYMYTCMCIHVCVFVSLCVSVCFCVCACVYISMTTMDIHTLLPCVCVCVRVCVCLCVCVCVCVCVHECICLCMFWLDMSRWSTCCTLSDRLNTYMSYI